MLCDGYAVMTSRWRSQNSAGDVSGSDQVNASAKSGMTDSLVPGGAFYDDSIRPKSFLRDEVDEFNRVLAELLQSRQRDERAADEDDLVCRSSAYQYNKYDDLPKTRQADRRTNSRVAVNDSETDNTSGVQHDFMLNSQASITHSTAQCAADDDREAVNDDDDDEDNDVLAIVEEDDCHLAAKDCNILSSRNIFTDDLFNEVSQVDKSSISYIPVFAPSTLTLTR